VKRPTLATFKSFLRKNEGKLWIDCISDFDPMVDGVRHNPEHTFQPARPADRPFSNNFGIAGVWCVFGSRDSFSEFDDGTFHGFHVYNCCGSFDIAVKK